VPPQLYFFVSIVFSFIAWGIVTARYIWPKLRLRPRSEALRPLLILHSFRFIGLAFLVPGVVSPDLPAAFAHSAAYGDIIATLLVAFAGIAAKRGRRERGGFKRPIAHRVDLQPLGLSRHLECVLPSRSCRARAGSAGCRLFPSDSHRAATVDHARAGLPDPSATSK